MNVGYNLSFIHTIMELPPLSFVVFEFFLANPGKEQYL